MVALIDLDHVKQVHAAWGHVVGDQVLQAAARRMESRLPSQPAFYLPVAWDGSRSAPVIERVDVD